eukprot:scpid32539/ scgid9902/ 
MDIIAGRLADTIATSVHVLRALGGSVAGNVLLAYLTRCHSVHVPLLVQAGVDVCSKFFLAAVYNTLAYWTCGVLTHSDQQPQHMAEFLTAPFTEQILDTQTKRRGLQSPTFASLECRHQLLRCMYSIPVLLCRNRVHYVSYTCAHIKLVPNALVSSLHSSSI